LLAYPNDIVDTNVPYLQGGRIQSCQRNHQMSKYQQIFSLMEEVKNTLEVS